ncbi:hypothetical protein ElyMa_005063300 [Elysia marginata]|uniref:Uncharacterized protein n=1 Tax=Elysia marginata TaxID=1093978 RepID=A0AAV4JG71_9GAST|nr:hypothetical protein ElyMa_005063300 [Elysia marginata]
MDREEMDLIIRTLFHQYTHQTRETVRVPLFERCWDHIEYDVMDDSEGCTDEVINQLGHTCHLGAYHINVESETWRDCLTIASILDAEKISSLVDSLPYLLMTEQTLKTRYRKSLNEEQALSANLLDQVEEKKRIELQVSGANKSSDNVRVMYMALQGEANVADGKTRQVTQTVAKHLFGLNLSDKELSRPSSALNFMTEAHVISLQQIAESLISCNHFTYAETRDYLDKHIYLDND